MTGEQSPVFIGSLRVPDEVVAAIRSGEWTMPSDASVMLEIFTELPVPEGKLYSLDWMLKETSAWWDAPAEEYEFYGAGQAVGSDYESLDPRKSILIGDLGIDMPLALDYDISIDTPRVMYLPSYASGWIEVAPNIATFLSRIRRVLDLPTRAAQRRPPCGAGS
jgi:hypothetical protein